jgi:hypothetical protein
MKGSKVVDGGTAMTTYEEVISMIEHLSDADQMRIVEHIGGVHRHKLTSRKINVQPRKSFYGALAHLGTAPSAEDIDEARREMWANFPREDI